MDRRNFFRILSAGSAGVIGGCGNKADRLIPLLVPEHQIVSGEEQWHPAVCTECSAGCGTLVRVMEAVRTVERNGGPVRERIAAIKKIEGNPFDPVSGGHLCARGQATVQSLYHPERLRGPMKRTGERGKAQFAGTTWDDALTMAAGAVSRVHAENPGAIAVLTGPLAGTGSLVLDRFTKAVGAPSPVICSLADFGVERRAAEIVFGWKGLPVHDLANAHFALGVGADFLGGWASPVYYARQYGNFRQGRHVIRGQLVQADSRLSITAAAADRWLPLRPGSEVQFLAAVGGILLELNLARTRQALPPAVLETFQKADTGKLLLDCGLPEKSVRDLVKELGESEAPLVIGGASLLHTNSMDAVMASHYVNVMLGNPGKRGGLLPPVTPAVPWFENRLATKALEGARLVLIDHVNPVYTMPRASGILEALSHAEMVISFAEFLDDSGAWSDLVLPAHHPLESEVAVAPAVSSRGGVAIGIPLVEPLYETRSLDQMFSDLARRLHLEYQSTSAKDIVQPLLSGEATFDDAARQGGIWLEPNGDPKIQAGGVLAVNGASFDGDRGEYPLHFQPYLSIQFHDGRGSNLPWMQELPDPASSSIWGLPVEIDPQTARQLRIVDGDTVRVQSAHGYIDAPAYIHPGAIPGVVSMPVGDGHQHYGRYASGRGGNPISILAPVWETSTGVLVSGGTRVRLTRVDGPRSWIQFSAPDREERDFGYR